MIVEPKNKTNMKKITALLAAVCLMAVSAPAFAADDKPITVSELPAASQQFIKANFPDHKVSYATMDGNMLDKEYKVVFTDGCKVEFAKNGQWKEVSHKNGAVPESIIPEQIRNYVAQNHPGKKIRTIDRYRKGYEVELTGGLELNFDSKYKVVKIGD